MRVTRPEPDTLVVVDRAWTAVWAAGALAVLLIHLFGVTPLSLLLPVMVAGLALWSARLELDRDGDLVEYTEGFPRRKTRRAARLTMLADVEAERSKSGLWVKPRLVFRHQEWVVGAEWGPAFMRKGVIRKIQAFAAESPPQIAEPAAPPPLEAPLPAPTPSRPPAAGEDEDEPHANHSAA